MSNSRSISKSDIFGYLYGSSSEIVIAGCRQMGKDYITNLILDSIMEVSPDSPYESDKEPAHVPLNATKPSNEYNYLKLRKGRY